MTLKLIAALLACFALVPFVCAHDGPHGGELFCDGQHKHHAELVVDTKTGKALVYLLDNKGKKEVPYAIASITMSVKGMATELALTATNVKDGKASQFSLKHPRFTNKLKPSDVTLAIVLEPGKPAVHFKPEHDDD